MCIQVLKAAIVKKRVMHAYWKEGRLHLFIPVKDTHRIPKPLQEKAFCRQPYSKVATR